MNDALKRMQTQVLLTAGLSDDPVDILNQAINQIEDFMDEYNEYLGNLKMARSEYLADHDMEQPDMFEEVLKHGEQA